MNCLLKIRNVSVIIFLMLLNAFISISIIIVLGIILKTDNLFCFFWITELLKWNECTCTFVLGHLIFLE